VTNKYKFEDIRAAYNSEQFDRQVFWLLRKYPEIESKEKNEKEYKINEEKLNVMFLSQIVGYR